MLIYLTADLMFAPRVQGAAQAAGLESRPWRGSEPWPDGVRALVVDLDASPAIEAIRAARAAQPELPILAFGPHVDREALEDARSAGADPVLPRSALQARLVPFLTEAVRGSG